MRFGESANFLRRRFCVRASLLMLLSISAIAPVLGAGTGHRVHLRGDAESPKKVFLIEGLDPVEPSAQMAVNALTKRLEMRSPQEIELYSDFLDFGTFHRPTNENRLVQFLAAKVGKVKPDIIIPITHSAVGFVIQHRNELARDIPIVYCCAAVLKNDAQNIPTDIPGVVLQADWASTLALAHRLQPDAKSVVVISDSPGLDQLLEQDVPGTLKPLLQSYETKYLTGLPYDELLKQVSRLPRNSIVLLRRVLQDGSGRSRGAEFAAELSQASTAPIYSASTTYFGSGILGGRMNSEAAQGTTVADLALDILSGKDPATLPHQSKIATQYIVDARQLERWGFAESSLPPGTTVEFRHPPLWVQYRKAILIALLTFAVLAGFIAMLLNEIRKRHEAEKARGTAEAEIQLRRNEMSHMMRVGIVSELSGGIAHELGQPLASILANAQAAKRLVATNSSDKKEIEAILDDIVGENTRAAEVIHRLRGLLKKGEHNAGLVDLNDQLTSTLRLVRSELLSRGIHVQTDLSEDLPPVMGDRVQLQQVFLNLIMNAMDAMASTPPSLRTLGIDTRCTQNGIVEVSITDHGPGLSPDQLKRIFEPYFTTKEHGLGLGLAICSTIVGSHDGQINISNVVTGGATAVVSLPAANRLAAVS